MKTQNGITSNKQNINAGSLSEIRAVRIDRRNFLKLSSGAVLAAVTPTFPCISVVGASPNSKPVVAGVGVGGVGFGQLQECEKAGFQISVLCDVDDVYAKKAYDRWKQARQYRDFREMLHAEGDKIDAVYVGTPDHTHAIIVKAALQHKKHVCCVKPLTRTIYEGRSLLETAKKVNTATQMTAAPHTSDMSCQVCEYIQGGVIGAVREVHIWSNRPVWPQGMMRPEGEDPVPQTLDWKLWIGPAPMRPYKGKWPAGHYALSQLKASVDWVAQYNGVYHPFNFRGWWDFGTGALGDMGCHHFNTVYRALKLRSPSYVNATSTKIMPESAPLASLITYDYPARENMPPLRLVWYDGGLQPPRPVGYDKPKMPEEGNLYIGDEGVMLHSWEGIQLLPSSRAAAAKDIKKSLPRRSGTWGEWFEACTGGEKAGCDFEWAVPLTEAVLLGNIALRTGTPLSGMALPENSVTAMPQTN